PRVDEEDYILSALQSRGNAAKILFIGNWLLIDLDDNVATTQADIIGKRVRFYIAHYNSLVVVQVQSFGHLRRKIANSDPKLALRRLIFVATLLGFYAQTCAEQLLPVSHHDWSRYIFAAPNQA